MKMEIRHVVFVGILVLNLGCYPASPFTPETLTKDYGSETHQIVGYKPQYIDEFYKNATGVNPIGVRVYRNMTGSRIFIDDLYSVSAISISDDGITKLIDHNAKMVYPDHLGNIVASSNDLKNGVTFSNNRIVNGARHYSIKFDPDGKFFGLEQYDRPIEVRSTESPNTIIYRIPPKNTSYTDILEKVYCFDNTVWVFVAHRPGSEEAGQQRLLSYHRLQISNSKVTHAETEDMPKLGSELLALVDFDHIGSKVLVESLYDVPFEGLAKWYLYDMESREYEEIGPAMSFGFFLTKNILENARVGTKEIADSLDESS